MPCIPRCLILPQNRSLANRTEAAALVSTLMHLCLQAIPGEILLAAGLGLLVLLDSFTQKEQNRMAAAVLGSQAIINIYTAELGVWPAGDEKSHQEACTRPPMHVHL